MLKEGEVVIKLRDTDYMYSADMVILKRENGKTYIAKLAWQELPEGSCINEPTLSVPEGKDFFQSLRGELRRLGYSENADQATVGALKEHLADMRKLVFDPPREEITTEFPNFIFKEKD